MKIKIDVALEYNFYQTSDILLQIEAAGTKDQIVEYAKITVPDTEHFVRVKAHDHIGERIWMRKSGLLKVDYSAIIDVIRPTDNIENLKAIPPHQLPGETIQYLFDSTYCPAAAFQNFVQDEFGNLEGGQRIIAMRDWIFKKLIYTFGSSDYRTNALDTFVMRRGVCRDYAHLLITFARASSIPARFVSVYAIGVYPQDFHAVVEVYLDGNWHLVDATFMAEQQTTVGIGIGRDAADVGFLTAYGFSELINKSIMVELV